jgi:hypothetical protein
MIENHSSINVFDEFDKRYSEKAIDICSLLSKFTIHIYTIEQYNSEKDKKQLPDVDLEESPLAFGIYNFGENASTTLAVIVIDEDYCNRLEFNNDELLAAMAHEVGHIIFFFLTNKEMYSKSIEEIKADEYAAIMGLGVPLVSAICKMIDIGLYNKKMIKQMEFRIGYLQRLLGI